MTKQHENKAHAGTIADYLHAREGHLWTREETERLLDHVRQVENTWMELIVRNEALVITGDAK